MGREERPGQFYDLVNPRSGCVYAANPNRVWRFWPETMKQVIENDLIIWPDEVAGGMERPRYKTYYDPNTSKPKPVSSWIERSNQNDREITAEESEFAISILTSGMNQEGGKVLRELLENVDFAYPKPVSLVRSIVRAATRGTDIVLDSFAGSGTTGHSVMSLNHEDGGQRRCILIEHDSNVSTNVTIARLKRFSETEKLKQQIVPSGFRYCKLGRTLLDEFGDINGDVPFSDLARYVYLLETGVPIPKRPKKDCTFLGVHQGRAIYLLYNGVLGDRRPAGGNVLTNKGVTGVPPFNTPVKAVGSH